MQTSLLERAFQIARSGEASTINQIAHALRREGYVDRAILANLDGQAIRRALRAACRTSRAGREAAPAAQVDAPPGPAR